MLLIHISLLLHPHLCAIHTHPHSAPSVPSPRIDTPEVINQVSQLFREHPSLIEGFNHFLPPGYSITVQDGSQLVSYTTPQGVSQTLPIMTHQMGVPAHYQHPGSGGAPPQPSMVAPVHPVHVSRSGSVAAGMAPHPGMAEGMPHASMGMMGGPPPGMVMQASAAANPQNNPASPEFDHAIQYVTKIKNRFQAQPGIYRKFLEILHAYQRQRENINTVLDKVSELFADHADLLNDFAFFLPDNVQRQARA